MGPRRVGKTVMVHQTIAEIISEGVSSKKILYVPLDHPLYSRLSLEEILFMFTKLNTIAENESVYLFFDEIQYIRNWERHLKYLVDSYPQHRFTATGSAAAALRLKSNESGAGRFTDFILPPLTFYEYIKLLDREEEFFVQKKDGSLNWDKTFERIEHLNREFIDYINFGGYPETILSKEIRENPRRFIRNDIIDKVLLRDLPSLYGISDIPELNLLLTTLAHNTGQEIDLQGLSQDSNLSKGTISKYLEYLEAAFLIKRIRRVDKNAKKFKREHKFKIYLANTSMYAGLFGRVDEEDKTVLGKLAETAVFSHFFHFAKYNETPCYARWRSGEVDMVIMDRTGMKPREAIEIKWSDRPLKNPSEIKNLLDFAAQHKLTEPGSLICHTLSKIDIQKYNNKTVFFYPTSFACFELGRSMTSREFKENLVKSATETAGSFRI